jgi:hypothetical protein
MLHLLLDVPSRPPEVLRLPLASTLLRDVLRLSRDAVPAADVLSRPLERPCLLRDVLRSQLGVPRLPLNVPSQRVDVPSRPLDLLC